MSFVKKVIFHPVTLLTLFLMSVYYQFFLFGKIPFPADTVVGAYFPWLDYKWGYPAGVPVKNALISDAFSQFFLWKYLGIELITRGEWPLWNNYSFSGIPLLATYQTSVLLPFNLLLLLPKYWGWGFFIFGQTLLAGLGMYYYLNFFLKEKFAKIGGALVFSLSGLMTTWVEFMTGVYAAATVPFILGSVEYYLHKRQARYLFILTSAFTILFLSGFAQMTIYGGAIFIIYLIFRYLTGDAGRKDLLNLLLSCLLATGIASVQLLPTYQHLNDSVRGDEAYSKVINYGLNKPYELVRLFAADFFGNPVTNNHWDNIYYHEQSSFLGTLTLPLIFPLLLKRFRKKITVFWWGIFTLSVILAIESPITKYIYSQPIPLLTYSSASRIFFVTSLAAAVLAGFGLDFIKDRYYKNSTLKSIYLMAAVLSGIIGGIFFIHLSLFEFKESTEVIPVLKNLNVTLKNLILPSALIFAGWLFLKAGRKWLIYILVLLLFADLSRYFIKHNPFVPQKLIFPEVPVTEFLNSEPGLYRIARADKEAFPPNTWTAYRLQSIEGYDPLAQENYARMFNLVNNRAYSSGIDRFMELNQYPSKWLNALNVKYLVAVKRDEKGVIPGEMLNHNLRESGYVKVFEDKNTAIVENPSARDRAYFAESLEYIPDDELLIKRISSRDFDPSTQAVIRETGNKIEKLGKGEIQVENYRSNNISLSTQTDTGGFLVFSDSFNSGWKLYENGIPARLYEVNGALRGFFVKPGSNQYRMQYEPWSFAVGLKITSFALVLLALLLAISLRRKNF